MNDHEKVLRAGLGYTTTEHSSSSSSSPVFDYLGAVWPYSIAGAVIGLGVAVFMKKPLTTSIGLGSLAGTVAGSTKYAISS